ncbi:hypothetical protein ACFTRD_14125 [Paenibacillus sp. NPDC056933]|uniref:hypothetical protein n=1 Tax=Paenibacillus sp. NPDC056933 TaxID=3345968 RepID=UPI003629922E
MIEYITPDRIANSIMQDSTFLGHYLLVEGKKDLKLFNKFISSKVAIKVAWGCENVKEVLNILDFRGHTKSFGVVDADFSTILEIPNNSENLFLTDFHDIEVMMFESNALQTVLNILGKNTNDKYSDVQEIREKLFELGVELGYLKLANKMYDLGLSFKPERIEGNQLKYKKFVSEVDFSFLGEDKMVETVIDYSRSRSSKTLDFEEIMSALINVKKEIYDQNHLVNGHDLSNLLYIFLKKLIKSTNKMLVDFNSIEDSLLLAYETNDFVKTKLCFNICEWSSSNEIEVFNESVSQIYKNINAPLEHAN